MEARWSWLGACSIANTSWFRDMTKNVDLGNLPSPRAGARKGYQGHTIMKTIASTLLDPSRRSTDARDFEAGLRRKIAGQDAAVEKVVEIYQMFLADGRAALPVVSPSTLADTFGLSSGRKLRPESRLP